MLRRARAEDITGIERLIAENTETILPRSETEISQLLDSFWVVEERGEIVGCACLEVYSPKIAEIRTVIVRADHRGKGFGKLLVEAAIAEAKSQHILEIMVITSSPEFFRQLNFGPCLNEKYALFLHGV